MAGEDPGAHVYDEAIYAALSRSDYEEVTCILRKLPSCTVDLSDEPSVSTPLQLACLRGRDDIVRKLLEQDADTNTVVEGEATPLICAVMSRQLAIISRLGKRQADLDARDGRGWTALRYAMNISDPVVSAHIGFFLIALGASVGEDGEKLLLEAVLKRRHLCALVLCAFGADPKLQHERDELNKPGETIKLAEISRYDDESQRKPISSILRKWSNRQQRMRTYRQDLAALARHERDLVLAHGLDLSAILCWTAEKTRVDICVMKFVLELAAERASTLIEFYYGEQGWKPLHFAAHEDNLRAAKVLIERGADVNCLTSDQQLTPLLQAAEKGSKKMVELLLTHDADIGARTRQSKTAFDLVPARGHRETMQILSQFAPRVQDKTLSDRAVDCSQGGKIDLEEASKAKSSKRNKNSDWKVVEGRKGLMKVKVIPRQISGPGPEAPVIQSTSNLYDRLQTAPKGPGAIKSPGHSNTPPPKAGTTRPKKIEINRSSPWWRKFDASVPSFMGKQRRLLRGSPSQGHPKRVKVAILDTGYDRHDNLILEAKERFSETNSLDYQNFVGPPESKRPLDTVGHGTRTMSLLLEVSQNLDVWMARVYANKEGDDTTSTAIAKAIQTSITNEVDIICMPFGFEDDVSIIERQIERANSKGILLFAAASNDRQLDGSHPISFPARLHNVFCINSNSSRNDEWSKFNPKVMSGKENFSVVGEENFRVDGVADGDLEGTSYATAIAAGIAALALECERIYRSPGSHSKLDLGWLEQNDRDYLRDFSTMKAFLKMLCSPEYQPAKENAILPWKMMNTRTSHQELWNSIKEARKKRHNS